VGDIDFKVISAAENSNKFQKTRFWKERSVHDMVTLMVTLGPTAQATLVQVNLMRGLTTKPYTTTFPCGNGGLPKGQCPPQVGHPKLVKLNLDLLSHQPLFDFA
jgi:hypothetical protein